jgi:hypothetical protein
VGRGAWTHVVLDRQRGALPWARRWCSCAGSCSSMTLGTAGPCPRPAARTARAQCLPLLPSPIERQKYRETERESESERESERVFVRETCVFV